MADAVSYPDSVAALAALFSASAAFFPEDYPLFAEPDAFRPFAANAAAADGERIAPSGEGEAADAGTACGASPRGGTETGTLRRESGRRRTASETADRALSAVRERRLDAEPESRRTGRNDASAAWARRTPGSLQTARGGAAA